MSLDTLSNLLQLNFLAGASLIVLGYESARYAPIGECAEQDIKAWLRTVRTQSGDAFQYVRTTEQGQDNGPATVHRIVTACTMEHATELAALWQYGPAQVEQMAGVDLSALVGQLVKNVEAVPNRKTWVASKGLKRS